jgi:tetratricopeptide (TPR) repeat protein
MRTPHESRGHSRKLIQPGANNKLQLVVNLALANKKLGKYGDAEMYYKLAIAELEPVADQQPRSMGIVLDNLGNMYDEQGKAARGEKLHRQALALFEKAGGPNDPDVLTCLNNVAEALIEQRKFDEALAIHQRIIAAMEKAGDPVNLAIVLDNEGRMFHRQGKFAESELLRRRALELFERGLGKNHPEVAICASNLAQTLVSQGKLDEAEPYFKRALDISAATYGPGHPELIPLLRAYADLLEKLKRGDDARALKGFKPLCARRVSCCSRCQRCATNSSTVNPMSVMMARRVPGLRSLPPCIGITTRLLSELR